MAGKALSASCETKHTAVLGPSPRCLPREMKACPHRDFKKNVPSSFINAPKTGDSPNVNQRDG